MLVLNCDNLISSCCSDFALAKVLSVLNGILGVIHIVVPIILMIALSIKLFQMVMNPDEKKEKKKIFNMAIAAVIVFFLPTFVNIVLAMLPNNYDFSACMKAAKDLDSIAKSNNVIYKTLNKEKKKSLIYNPEDYEKGDEKKTDNEDNSNSGSAPTNSKGDGSILLIAGHSYPPYCSTGGLSDCRGKDPNSGYAEEVETRKLVKLIKSNLDSMGVKSDIANALLAGDDNKMNKSFYIESRMNTKLFNKFNWSKYNFVLEVHFNATSAGNAKGTLLCKKSSSYKTKADNDIVNAVISHTGASRLGDSIQGLNNVTYFSSRNIPIVYLETEFYDNASAMRTYTSHINEIAHDIAAAIKKNYG